MKKFYTLLLSSLSFLAVNAQTAVQPEPPDTFNYYKFPALTLGAGVTGFMGDFGSNNLMQFAKQRTTVNAGIEQRLGKTFGISANFLWGGLSANERQINNPANFGTDLMMGDIRLNLYWDNNWLLKHKSKFAPYMFGGVGFATFNPHTDLKDKNGNNYFYWTDGSVRNLPQTQQNLGLAAAIRRDYDYETAIDSPGYKTQTLTFPVGMGFRFKLAPLVDAYIQGTYFFTMTDDMDARRTGGNDAFMNVVAGFQIRLGRGPKDPKQERYKDVDFSELEKADTDGDGVKDKNDMCPSTPTGVKVDGKGCPEDAGDNDKDGVPNYMDKEPATPAGSTVDAEGKTIPDTKLQKMADDTIAVPRDQLQQFPESLPEPVKLPKGSNDKSSIDMAPVTAPALAKADIPTKFKSADYDSNGKVDSKEVAMVIDEFFDGSTKFDVDTIYELIDYYFDNN